MTTPTTISTENIETDPLFSMLCQWIVEDTMENAGKDVKKTKKKDTDKYIKNGSVKAKEIGQ